MINEVTGECAVLNPFYTYAQNFTEQGCRGNGIRSSDFFSMDLVNKSEVLAGFIMNIMARFEAKCFKAFYFFVDRLNGQGLKQHTAGFDG